MGQGNTPEPTVVNQKMTHPGVAFQWKYNLSAPAAAFELPKILDEVSGLSIGTNPNVIAAVQDELGVVYMIDKKTGALKNEYQFWKTGDYEGLEMVGDDMYVVKSSGTIYQIKNMGTEAQEVIKHNTMLSKEHDVEGLCYDKKNDRLLLACKGLGPKIEGAKEEIKAICSFQIAGGILDTVPVLTIRLKAITDYMKAVDGIKDMKDFKEFFNPELLTLQFAPSAIAIHPITNHIYVTSSKGKMLCVFQADGQVLHLEKLEKKIHPQPEGLYFEDDGTLYVSNEAKKGIAKLYRFDYQKGIGADRR